MPVPKLTGVGFDQREDERYSGYPPDRSIGVYQNFSEESLSPEISGEDIGYYVQGAPGNTESHLTSAGAAAGALPPTTATRIRTGTIPEMTSLADRIKRSGNPSPVITLTTDKGDQYQGQAFGGKANGRGKMTYVCGDVYQGYFSDGHPHGKGRIEFANGGGSAEGMWVRGKMNGRGRREWGKDEPNGWLSYEGEFKEGEMWGKGRLVERAGHVYEGDFHRGVRSGRGICKFSSGDSYEGSWVKGRKHGEGTFRWRDGYVYQGSYFDDLQHGRGRYNKPNGERYEGDFKAGMFHGVGKYTWSNGRAYEGEWRNNLMHGRGADCDMGTRYAVEYGEGLLLSKEWSQLDGRGLVLTPAQTHTPEDAAGMKKVDGGLRQWRARRLLHNGYAERLGGAVAWNS